MRPHDFAPLYRSTVGFDHLFRLIDAMSDNGDGNTYPPYNIVRTGDNSYEIAIAVAGFTSDELTIEAKENALRISGAKAENTDESRTFLHRGIAQRGFERRFQLADFVEVQNAELKDGLLRVSLVRNLPERMKARVIAIKSGSDAGKIVDARAEEAASQAA